MDKLALTLPGGQTINSIVKVGPNEVIKDATLGGLLSAGLNVVFFIATFLAFIWLIWGAMHYIFAGGDKEQLKKARDRITWAIVGLIITFLSFLIAQFIEQVMQPQGGTSISFLANTVYAAGPAITPGPVDLSKVYGFGNTSSLGEGINKLVIPVFSIASTAVIIYFLIGGLKFIFSGGDKEAVGKARNMITHSIIGFLILILAFVILKYIPEFFGFNFALFN